MNLNIITIQNLQLCQWETQKNLLPHRFLAKRAIIDDPSDRLPYNFVQSELLDSMVESCKNPGVKVMKADSGLGTSIAAKFVLKNSAGGIMFCNCQSSCSGGTYWKGVTEAVDIPKNFTKVNSD
jgi:hypothetical protein